MNAFERDRLARGSEDAVKWLYEVKRILTYSEAPEPDIAASLKRAAEDFAKSVDKLLKLGKEKAASAVTETADYQPDGQ